MSHLHHRAARPRTRRGTRAAWSLHGLLHGFGQPVEVGPRVDLGDAVEGALAELWQLRYDRSLPPKIPPRRKASLIAATLRPVFEKSTTNSLKQDGKGMVTPGMEASCRAA